MRRPVIDGGGGLEVALAVALASCTSAARYPNSPEWQKGRFHNPAEWPQRQGAAAFLRWQLGHRSLAPAHFRPPCVANDGLRLRENRTAASVTWIGHATALLQLDGISILTDPIFSTAIGGVVDRYAPPGVALAQLPPIDVVVISHNHRDHLDESSVRALGARVTYVVPLGLGAWFKERGLHHVVELDWWQSTTIGVATGATLRVTLVPAQHWSARWVSDRDRSLWGGYILDGKSARFYFAGDTGYPAAFAEIGRRFPGIDLALLPIGAYAPRWHLAPQHMAPDEAAAAFRLVGARQVVPIHWGTFHLSDEPMDEPPRLFAAALGPDRGRLILLPIGGSYFLRRPVAEVGVPH